MAGTMDFEALAKKVQVLRDKKARLEAEAEASEKQAESIRNQLVSTYGEDYEKVFSDAVVRLEAWEAGQ